MNIASRVSGSLAVLIKAAEKRGYEQGVADTLAEIERAADRAPSPAAKPRPKKKATAKAPKRGTSKTARAEQVIKSLPPGEKVRRATINEMVEGSGLTRHDAGNALAKMAKKGELEALPDNEGYVLKAPTNGTAAPA